MVRLPGKYRLRLQSTCFVPEGVPFSRPYPHTRQGGYKYAPSALARLERHGHNVSARAYQRWLAFDRGEKLEQFVALL